MSKHEYGGININDNRGAFAIGAQNTVNQQINSQGLQEFTTQLLDVLKQEDLPEENKSELKEIIEATVDSSTGKDKPNKTIVKSLLSNANTIINTISKSPDLITAYQKWEHFITSLIS